MSKRRQAGRQAGRPLGCCCCWWWRVLTVMCSGRARVLARSTARSAWAQSSQPSTTPTAASASSPQTRPCSPHTPPDHRHAPAAQHSLAGLLPPSLPVRWPVVSVCVCVWSCYLHGQPWPAQHLGRHVAATRPLKTPAAASCPPHNTAAPSASCARPCALAPLPACLPSLVRTWRVWAVPAPSGVACARAWPTAGPTAAAPLPHEAHARAGRSGLTEKGAGRQASPP